MTPQDKIPQDRSPQDKPPQDKLLRDSDRSKSKNSWQIWAAIASLVVAILAVSKLIRVLYPLPNSSSSSSAITSLSPSPRSTSGESQQPINSTPVHADPLSGTWEQYIFDDRGRLRYLSRGTVSKPNGEYIITIDNQAQAPDITNSLAVFNVFYNEPIWTFKSNWGNETATFKLKRVSDKVFEGFSFVNGKPIQKNRFVKVE